MDETGIDHYLCRPYARSAKGQPVHGAVSGKKYKRTSVVAAQMGKTIVAPMQYDGTMDSVLFEAWFERMLLPALALGSVIVMDNASFHRKTKLQSMAALAGCTVIFLPPYSPELNPIEHFWAWLKNNLRSLLSRANSFDAALRECF